jgi:hypothetical protein
MANPAAPTEAEELEARPVSIRKVFFVNGFDPRGARWYYRFFKREGRKYPSAGDFTLTSVSEPGSGDSPRPDLQTCWTIRASENDRPVETRFCLLQWDDIIHANWPKGSWSMLSMFGANFAAYLGNGTLARLLRTAYPTFICAAYPSALVAVLLLAAAIAGWAAAAVASLLAPAIVSAVIAAAVLLFVTAKGLPLLNRRFNIFWLNRIYAFNRQQAKRQVAGLEKRIRAFAGIIAAARKSDPEAEILLIGHSTGCQIALSVLAETIRQLDGSGIAPRISFLTLGSNMTMLSWQKEAGWFHDDIKAVASEPTIRWVDFSIISDGACFALHDPVAAAGVRRPKGSPDNLKLLNVRNFNLFSQASLDRMRPDKLLLHFQYMMAPEKIGEYDFFRIIAGAQSLWHRYRDRDSVTAFEGVRLNIFRRRE